MKWFSWDSKPVGHAAFRRFRICGWLLLTAAARGIAADVSSLNFGPPGSWVKPHFFNQQALSSLPDSSADDHLLLLENQINAGQKDAFTHSIRQVLTLAGVQKDANLTISFDPGCESLTLHWARVWRGAQHLERLDTNTVRVVQPEREADDFILSGRRSAVLVLNDVRVGDVIDYAYSIRGDNPVYGGHFSSTVPVQLFEQPAERLFTRVLWPAQRRLYARAHGCAVQPGVAADKDTIEYVWDFNQIPALGFEDLLPTWFDPQPWVQLSDLKSWAEVNQWASALFQTTAPLSPALAQKIAEWKQIPGQEQQILAVLRFVQDEVRYFGFEIGASSQKPADPSTVYSRRFGDCKDKSLLFVTTLRALGIEAYPVLVNTLYGRGIDDWQPSAGIFDHCIAVVRCDGQTYWLDPTMNYQRGPLAAHYLPSYELGLVVSPQTTGLTAIQSMAGLPQTTVSQYFQLRGKTEPADLKVVTLAQGRDADSLRAFFATTKRADLEKIYTHLYSSAYPGIKMSFPIVFEDDEVQNRVQTTEYYSIDNAWGQPDKARRVEIDFYAGNIEALLKKPVDVDRKYPLAIGYPEHVFMHTEVALPETWPAEADKKSVLDPAFSFQKAYRRAGNKLVIEYDYQSLTDSVSPDRVAEYLQRLNQTSQSLGYALTWR